MNGQQFVTIYILPASTEEYIQKIFSNVLNSLPKSFQFFLNNVIHTKEQYMFISRDGLNEIVILNKRHSVVIQPPLTN